jgi:hypothetical protein
MTSSDFRDAVRRAYEYAHTHCHYAPTDKSYPVGEDGKMDCTGLVLRALYEMGIYLGALNCDQMDMLMPSLGFTKSTDIDDVYRYPVCVVQWCYPHCVGTVHVNHTYVSVGSHDDGTIDKYDTGSDARIQAEQPFDHVLVGEWGDTYVFKHLWHPKEDNDGIRIQIGGRP